MNQQTKPIEQAIEECDREAFRQHTESGELERKEILQRFPIEKWPELPLERYALGLSDSDTYSRWLEFGSPHLGSMAGGSARKHLIYKRKKGSGWYYDSQYANEQEAWRAIRSGFVQAFEFGKADQWADIDAIESLHGGGGLRAKTMHIYFPEKVLPITSRDHILYFLQLLGVPLDEIRNLSRINLNQALLAKLRSYPSLDTWTTNELGFFLYSWADPRETKRVVKIAPGENAKYWDDCRAGGYICVGWDEVGDLREFESFEDMRERFGEAYASQLYNDQKSAVSRKSKELWSLTELEPGDVVIANQGISKVLAVGTVVDPGYEWRPERSDFRHTVRVQWDENYAQDIDPQKKWGLVTIAPVPLDLYKKILSKRAGTLVTIPPLPIEPLLLEIADALERKGQAILYGPPGTGKTYFARRFAIWWLLQQRGETNPQAVLTNPEDLTKAEQKLKTVQLARRVWWVVANPREWTWDQLFHDNLVSYRYGRLQRNYPLVQVGDLVIGYQATPVRCVVALAEVSKAFTGTGEAEPKIELKPLRRIQHGIEYSELAADPILSKSEPIRFHCQGTLFALTGEEAEHLQSILVDRNPDLDDLFRTDSGVGDLTWVTFHPSYNYEDFIEGFRPVDTGQGLVLRLEDGILKRICRDAQANPERHYLLVIDEINRANIAKVFGEIITLLEKDKRGMIVTLPQSKESFTIPPRVHILGTMNTADRSIKLLDAALRRRFAFIELMPDLEPLKGEKVNDLALDDFLETLNRRIAQKEGREKQIGHAFLLGNNGAVTEPEEFARRFRQEILPLLQEYCYDDYSVLASYLGNQLVDSANQSLNIDILYDDNALIRALEETVKSEESPS